MSFQVGDYVRITKIGSTDEPYYPTPSWDEYDENKVACNSVPNDYLVEGQLRSLLELEKPLLLYRENRNGIHVPGIFRTSYVKNVLEDGDFDIVFETMNSRYRMEKILPPTKSESGESNWPN